MNKYTVYFEIYGKKMKVEIKAHSENAAKEQVRNDISFHGIVPQYEPDNQDYQQLEKIKKALGL